MSYSAVSGNDGGNGADTPTGSNENTRSGSLKRAFSNTCASFRDRLQRSKPRFSNMHMSDAVDPQVSQPGSTSAQATTETNCLRQLFQKLSDRKTPSHLSKGDDDTEVSQANLYPVSLKQIDAQVV